MARLTGISTGITHAYRLSLAVKTPPETFRSPQKPEDKETANDVHHNAGLPDTPSASKTKCLRGSA